VEVSAPQHCYEPSELDGKKQMKEENPLGLRWGRHAAIAALLFVCAAYNRKAAGTTSMLLLGSTVMPFEEEK